MRSTLTKEIWTEVYKLLEDVTPVPFDCGTLCGAACCTCKAQAEADAEPGEEVEDMGMYLLPNEHLMHERPADPADDWLEWAVDMAEDYDFPESWKGPVFFVNCKTPPICPRDKRPFQCRTFPLRPILDEDGRLGLITYDGELPYSCPLIDSGEVEITGEFYQAVYQAWSILIQDPLIHDLVEYDSMYEEDEE